MSVQRSFAQRNNNNTKLVPVRYSDTLSFANITNAAIYTLNITNAHLTKGMYYVDLDDYDSSGNSIDLNGTFTSLQNPSGDTLPIVCFVLNIETSASAYPGLEIPISFKTTSNPFLTIGILSASSLQAETIPLPYIVSPPFPPTAGYNISPNITLRSDGDNFDVAASGPAGWMGVPALSFILSAYSGL
jgi:hypothetical protein